VYKSRIFRSFCFIIYYIIYEERAAAAAAFVKDAVPLPPRSSFALGNKQDQVLNVEAGMVSITSMIALSKHVALTSNCWVHLLAIHRQIEAKEFNR